jgi:hypothetical protein
MHKLTVGGLFSGIGASCVILVNMKTFSDETKRKMSESAKARCTRSDWIAPATRSWTSFIPPDQLQHEYEELVMTQQEIAERHGVTLKIVQTAMRKAGIVPRLAAKRDQYGDRNDSWRGDDAGYKAFHLRLRRLRGCPRKCEVCGTSDPKLRYEWASINGKYDDPADYKRMCRKCHFEYDEGRNPRRDPKTGRFGGKDA